MSFPLSILGLPKCWRLRPAAWPWGVRKKQGATIKSDMATLAIAMMHARKQAHTHATPSHPRMASFQPHTCAWLHFSHSHHTQADGHSSHHGELSWGEVRFPAAIRYSALASVPVSQGASGLKAKLAANVRHLISDHVTEPDLRELPANNGRTHGPNNRG